MATACLIAGAGPASALSAAFFSTAIQGPGAGMYDYDLIRGEVVPFSVSTGFIPQAYGAGFDITATLTGGSAPAAQISGYGILGNSNGSNGLGSAVAAVNYVVRANAQPAWTTALANLSIPINVSGVLRTSVMQLPIPSAVRGGFAEAAVYVTALGVTIEEIASTYLNPPVYNDSGPNSFSRTFSVGVGQLISVRLFARGNAANATFDAFADPTFSIDPTATFDFGGQAIRFADAVALEFSPGISNVPEPNTALLLGLGLGVLVSTRRGGSAQRQEHPDRSL